ncbi:F-box/kelch-repeat protein At3g23880-like [Bidens hawaiensis]|uniref:F-box/kelch-repeat protein At3g23880-like n=1 Tax=Bidens hawaiensis TaxID=980011 RepID=UPI0040496F26
MSDYIPLSIQEEIMKRLPTKSLMQFRTVSKAWKSLIDSSKFVVDYSVNHTHQQHLLVSYPAPENFETKHVSFVDDESFPHNKFSLTTPVPELRMPKILGSSHGLFCLCSIGVDLYDPRRNKRTAVLWNPSIRKSVAIDVLGSTTNTVIGFGVCPHTTDPKLVKIQYNYDLLNVDTIAFSPWHDEVHTLSVRAWRSIPTINQLRNTTDFMEKQVDLDGTIYWLAVDGSTISMMPPTFFMGYKLIISFDLTSEEFVEASLPETLALKSCNSLAISKLKESLVVVDVVNDANKLVYGVWMMEHGVPNSFTKLFSINLPDLSITTVLGFRRNNEPIFAIKTNTHDVNVHEFHSEDLSYARITGSAHLVSAGSYMETLLLQDQ